MNIDHQKLRDLTARLLKAGGCSETEATIVTDHLVEANLSGHDSHGVGMLPHYFRNLAAGTLVPNQTPDIVSEAATFAVWDGRSGYGQVIARDAMAWAIGAARRHGVAVHGLRNTHHIGRVGTYGEIVAKAGLVSVHFVNGVSGPPAVAPYRGREGRFSTNPICIAVPGTAATAPIILDFATSRIALGKVRVAYNEGKQVVAGALIDTDGKPTTNPGVMYNEPRGNVLPFGEHKGSGLALIAELLAGAIVGSGTIQPAHSRDRGIVNAMLTRLHRGRDRRTHRLCQIGTAGRSIPARPDRRRARTHRSRRAHEERDRDRRHHLEADRRDRGEGRGRHLERLRASDRAAHRSHPSRPRRGISRPALRPA